MTARTLAAATQAALDDDIIAPLFFVHLAFDSDPLYLHTDIGSITTLSQTWSGVGDLAGIEEITEVDELESNRLKLFLSLVDEDSTSVFNEATTQNFYQRAVTMYFGARNTLTGALLATPDEIWKGKIDDLQIDYYPGEISQITAVCVSEHEDFKKRSGKLYSNAQLQDEYAGDTFFKHLEAMVNTRIVWGTDGTSLSGGPLDDPIGDQQRDLLDRFLRRII